MAVTGGAAQRVVIVAASTAENDARTQRIGDTLAMRGHRVRIVARAGNGLPPRQQLASGVLIDRVAADPPTVLRWLPSAGLRRMVGAVLAARRQARAAAGLQLEADIVHAMGLLSLPTARRVARETGARLVYDARDLYVDARNLARLPAGVRAIIGRVERRYARAADAVVTVNEALAGELTRRWTIPPPTVVHNCPPRWSPPPDPMDRLRAAAGIADGAAVALYHGGFSRERGLEAMAEALLDPRLADVHAIFLGYGELEAELRSMAAEPRRGGRLHVLRAVPPDEVLSTITTADVAVIGIEPTTLNHRLSTPNKLFEAIAAGVPVVATDLPGLRSVVADPVHGPLGVLVPPGGGPDILAGAIRGLLDQAPADRATLRARCLDAGRERWNWETESVALLAAYQRLTGRPW